MRALLFTSSLILFFTFPFLAQLPDSIFNQVNTLMNNLEQALIE